MAGGGGGEEGEFGLQIAPMLDVMFVLLLYFMVMAGSVAREGYLGVAVPGKASESAEATPPNPTVIIEVGDDGVVMFQGANIGAPGDEELMALRTRLQQLTQFAPDQAVIIRPGPNARHNRVIAVLNACSAANIKTVSFSRVAPIGG